MSRLRITVCQVNIEWEAKETNLARFAELISQLKERTDLIILPEMFTTGFSMEAPSLAEDMNGPAVQWMIDRASELNCSVMASFLCRENGNLYNRFVLADKDGSVSHYDKRHLFSFAHEDGHFTAGNDIKTFASVGWRIRPLVCYDLRFPVWSRNTKENPYDLLVAVANWPAARASAWKSLLMARAHENQCFVVGVNRVGKDGKGIGYNGDSMVVSPKGELLSKFEDGAETIRTVELNKAELDDFREKFRPLDDADEFELRP